MSQHMKQCIKRLRWLAQHSEATWRNNATGETLKLPALVRRGDYFVIGKDGQSGVDVGDEHYFRCVGDVECIDTPHQKLVELLSEYLEAMEKEKIMAEIIDAVGRVAQVGDDAVFALGGRGAQEFIHGRGEKINPATVLIAHGRDKWNPATESYQWVDDYSQTTPRKAKCFVIVNKEKK